jgi:hypothetical protein
MVPRQEFIEEMLRTSRRDARHNLAFTFLYLAGLSPFLWKLRVASLEGPPPGRIFMALFVVCLFLSPVLWSKLLRWRRCDRFQRCPHCSDSWKYGRHKSVVTTGRCGCCGVQILAGDTEVAPLTSQLTGAEFQKISRVQFMDFRKEEHELFLRQYAPHKKRHHLFFGSSLAILVLSILFLPFPYLLVLPVAWYLCYGGTLELTDWIQNRKRTRSHPQRPSHWLRHCPACSLSIQDYNGMIVTCTGRCGKCRNVILEDDVTKEVRIPA